MTEPASPRLRLFPPPFRVELDEGFSPEKDLFGRAPIAKGLTQLLSNVDQPLVLAIDGDWGTGKTTFLRFWAGELKKSGFPVVFFDAFENDFSEDPFVAIASDIYDLVAQTSPGRTAKSFAEKATGAGKVILRSALKVGVKAATMGAINAADLEELSDSVSEEAAAAFDDHIGARITAGRKDRDAITEFRNALSKLPAQLQPATDDPKPLIFIIDELDRCRPNFALLLLERIKHFYSVENVHFVLGVNTNQLANSVNAVYGSGVDSRHYLQKFIHVNWTLSQREEFAHESSRRKYVTYLSSALGYTGKNAETLASVRAVIETVADQRDMSFRTIERIMAVVSLALSTTPVNYLRAAPLIAGLAVMKVIEPKLYEKAKRGRLRFSEVEAFFKFEELKKDTEKNWDWIEDWWRFSSDPDAPEEVVDRMGRGLFSYHFRNRLDLLPYTASVVMDDASLQG